MRAHCLIRHAPWYRREIFVNGLRAAGHEVFIAPPVKADRNTLLLIWNRYGENHALANTVEAAGGVVLVAENGYIGARGSSPKFDVHPGGPKPYHYYAISRSFHNDDTRINVGAEDRLKHLALDIKPPRAGGDRILVCPNRAFGVPERMMHPDWAERAAARIRKQTALPVVIRNHPGNDAPKRDIYDDLKSVRAVVIWSSSCGVHALAEGIPVICDAPYWICKSAAVVDANTLMDDSLRMAALRRLAHAQWTCEEIDKGIPFGSLLS